MKKHLWVLVPAVMSGLACGDGSDLASGSGKTIADVTAIPSDGMVLFVETDQGLTFDSDARLARWIDQSGLNHDGVPLEEPAVRGPDLGGVPSVVFSGAGGPSSATQGLAFGSGYEDFRGGFTSFAFVRVNDPGAPLNDILLGVPELNGEGGQAGVAVNAIAVDGSLEVSYSIDRAEIHGRSPATGRWALVSVVQEPSGTTTIFVDGVAIASGALPLPPTGRKTATLFGGITKAETVLVLLYNKALSTSDRTVVEKYVSAKWSQP
jgi:hypothetical protein